MAHLNYTSVYRIALALTLTLTFSATAAKLAPRTRTHTEERPVFYDQEAMTLKCKLLVGGCRLSELGASPENGADELCPANASGVISSPSYDQGWYVHCTCDEGLKPTGDKRACLQIRSHGKSCQLHSEGDSGVSVDPCNTDQHQECLHGVCGCAEGRIRDRLDGRCKLKFGESCVRRDDVLDSPCTRFARCEGHAQASRCECVTGYKQTANGACAGYDGSACLLDEDCPAEQGLVCFNQKCDCRHPRDQIYDWKADKCMLKIGANCDASPGAFPVCVPTSQCSRPAASNTTSINASGVCGCEPGQKVAVGNLSCYRILHKYGESCMNLDLVRPSTVAVAGPSWSRAPVTLVCDSAKGFACANGSCGCAEPSAVYEPDRDACVVPIGGRCGQMEVVGSCVVGAGGEKQCEHYSLPCGKDAYCDEEGRCKLHMLTFASEGEVPLAGHRGEHLESRDAVEG